KEAIKTISALEVFQPGELFPEVEFALRLHEDRLARYLKRGGGAIARARGLATGHNRPAWLARTKLAEPERAPLPAMHGTAPNTDVLAEEALSCAPQSGYASLEAAAYRLLSWRWQQDTERERQCIESGLEAARAAHDRAVEAELVARQATWLLRVGRFR